VTLTAAAFFLLGAITANASSLESALAGTSWRLVEFQSMDDSVGTVRPADPSLYTMRLDADGTATLRLNCNRANGTWSAESGADPSSGRFAFGPLTTTRALCPPPSLDQQIASQAEFIRSYLLNDGRLYLSLMADGGIYAWVPETGDVALQTTPDPEIEAAILQASPDYTREIVEAGGPTGVGRYLYSRFDLDGDGRAEVFAYLLGSIFCGSGGCNLQLFTPIDGALSLVNSFSITRTPIIVSPERTNGWHDLCRLESGGGAPPSYVRHTFDGMRYVEKERLPADPPPEGTKVLAGEFTFQDGIALEPQDDNPTAPFSTADYDATTLLRCRNGRDAEFGRCPAGVLRMEGGQGSVVLQNQRGEQFTINFMKDYVNATNREVKARLAGDTWIVTIDGADVYEVPLALIQGG